MSQPPNTKIHLKTTYLKFPRSQWVKLSEKRPPGGLAPILCYCISISNTDVFGTLLHALWQMVMFNANKEWVLSPQFSFIIRNEMFVERLDSGKPLHHHRPSGIAGCVHVVERASLRDEFSKYTYRVTYQYHTAIASSNFVNDLGLEFVYSPDKPQRAFITCYTIGGKRSISDR